MIDKDDIHFTIALLINFIAVALLVRFLWSAGDKEAIVFILVYPAQVILNGIIWLMMRMDRDPRYRIYRWMTLALIIGFIPVSIIASMY